MTGRSAGDHQNVLICGPTDVGKTFLVCALDNQARRQGRSAFYVRLSRLLPALCSSFCNFQMVAPMSAQFCNQEHRGKISNIL